jgi:hypothetical protein
MNLTDLQRKLIAVARANPPSDRVPLAFEKRILALIATGPVLDRWAPWARALWCAAAPCVAIMLFSAWAVLNNSAGNNTPSTDLSQQFDNTLLADVGQIYQDSDSTR